MKKKLFYTTFCLFALVFSSCTEEGHHSGISDDSDTDATNGEVVSDGSLPVANEDLGILFPVTSVRTTESGTSYFNYQSGKLLDGTSREDYSDSNNFDFNIKEDPLQINITFRDEYDNSRTGNRYYTDIKTNKYGFITEAKYSEAQSDEATIDGNLEATYNTQGYITKLKIYEQIDDDEYNLFTVDFVWANGDLKQITTYFEEKNQYDNGQYECQYESDTYTLEYSNNKYPNTGIYFWNNIYEDDITFDFMWYSGLFGKTTKNIPIKAKDTYSFKETIGGKTSFTEEGEDNYDIKPSYNQNGSISSIRYTSGVNEDDEDDEGAYQETYYYGYN